MIKKPTNIISKEREDELTRLILETNLEDINLSEIRESTLMYSERCRTEFLLYTKLYNRRKSESLVNCYAEPKKLARRKTI